jgi:hypothetical protein
MWLEVTSGLLARRSGKLPTHLMLAPQLQVLFRVLAPSKSPSGAGRGIEIP